MIRGRINGEQGIREQSIRICSDPSLAGELAAELTELAVAAGLCERRREPQVVIALAEAISNAIVHGNLEVSSDLRDDDRDLEYFAQIRERSERPPYRDRQVEIITRIAERHIEWTITDEGPGFDVEGQRDPTDPDNVLLGSGRGILLMRSLCDDLFFNDRGNQVTLVVRKA